MILEVMKSLKVKISNWWSKVLLDLAYYIINKKRSDTLHTINISKITNEVIYLRSQIIVSPTQKEFNPKALDVAKDNALNDLYRKLYPFIVIESNRDYHTGKTRVVCKLHVLKQK